MAEEIKSEEVLNDVSAEQKISTESAKQVKLQEISDGASDNQEVNPEAEKPKKIENLEKALKIFKRKSAGIISEVRKREAYDSPSVKRKKKSKEARRKNKKNYRFGNNY